MFAIIPAVLLILLLLVIFLKKNKTPKTKSVGAALVEQELNNMANKNSNNNGSNDVQYLLKNLDPNTSTHLDVLLLIATTPNNISMTENIMVKEEELKEKRLDYLHPDRASSASSSNSKNDTSKTNGNAVGDFDLDGAWGGDGEDEEDDNVKANKARQEEKERLKKEVAAASGKSDDMIKQVRIEGVDDGVLGQKWVEKQLTKMGQWPPKASTHLDKMDEYKTDLAVRRNLCMTMGRLNAQTLNTSTELQEAGPKRLIDTTYFQSTMEYRKRTIVLLEAALRIIGSTRSYKLYKTLVECYTMFKNGTSSVTNPEVIEAFQKQMEKTFDGKKGVPRIIISKLEIITPEEEEVATEDTSVLEMELNRVHAENFMKQKVAMAMKQGIPPEIALNTFREGWWILLRCEKLDKGDKSLKNTDFIDKHPILANLSIDIRDKFKQEEDKNLLINAWPFMVSNIKQVTGKLKVKFLAPSVPGKYKFYIDVKSQEYLGCDQTFTLEKEVLDKATVKRVEKKKEEEVVTEDDADEDEEPKKTK